MGHAYTPGLKISSQAVVYKQRILPLKGEVKVKEGEKVSAEQIVAETKIPGSVQSMNIVNILGISPAEIKHYLKKKEKERVEKDEIIAENKPFLKWFKKEIRAPWAGTIESISEITGQILLREKPRPLSLKAFIDGEVVETFPEKGVVIKTTATYLQGILGLGGEVVGELEMVAHQPDQIITEKEITPELRGKIMVGGSLITASALLKAKKMGVRGIISGGMKAADLKRLLGYDLGVAITGREQIGYTLILTEGFGQISMAKQTFELLKSRQGAKTSLSGTTQIRAGVIRPEIIIPLPLNLREAKHEKKFKSEGLKIGDWIRIIREPFFGQIGRIKSLPPELKKITTETEVRVMEVELAGGRIETIPRANVEIIENY
jgi:hypothetical protein